MISFKRLLTGAALIALAGVATFFIVTVQRQREVQRGAVLAAVHCSACHLEPAPDILPRRSWRAALGYMGYWLGIEDTDYLNVEPEWVQENVRARLPMLQRDGVYPATPVLDEAEWGAVRRYFLANAPRFPLPQVGKPELQWGLSQFRSFAPRYRPSVPITTLVHIRESTSEVYIGDSGVQALTTLAGDGSVKIPEKRFSPAVSAVALQFVGNTAYVTSIGDLMASEAAASGPAHIAAVPLVDESIAEATATVVLDGLYRAADMEAADLNGDGRLDFIVAGFGSNTGKVSWFEALPDGGFEEHDLLGLSGAVKVETHDFNGDGLPDIMVLVSNAREGLHLFLNEGGNRFSDHQVSETHSAYGHTYFELQDFNGDGLMDVLVANGDNVDSDPFNTLKNYHGVRIYLNRGGTRFEEAYFYPMYGALIAKAADFDGDGDLDIAALSFYPDFASERRESFTYLENRGDLEFVPFTDVVFNQGRWMTMDVGDMDGDGDADVVLGGAYLRMGMSLYTPLFDRLSATGPAVLMLENMLR